MPLASMTAAASGPAKNRRIAFAAFGSLAFDPRAAEKVNVRPNSGGNGMNSIPGTNSDFVRELNRDIGFAPGHELRVALVASQPQFGSQLDLYAKSPKHISDVDGRDATRGGITYDNCFSGQQRLLELVCRADVKLRPIFADPDADGALSHIDYRSRDDVAICHHLIQNNPRQDRNVGNFAALDALSQVSGFTEADAHLLPDKPHELRLQLTDNFSHAAGAQNFDFGGFPRVRNEIHRAGQDCGERLVDHRRLPSVVEMTRKHCQDISQPATILASIAAIGEARHASLDLAHSVISQHRKIWSLLAQSGHP